MERLLGSRRGFTLIEMSLVVVLLFLAAALVSPNLVSIRNSRKAADMRAAIVRLPVEARNEARKSGQVVRLRISEGALVLERIAATTDTSTQSGDQSTSDATEVKRVDLGNDWKVDGVWTDGVEAGTEDWKWDVSPDGSASSAAIRFQENNASHSLSLEADGGSSWADGDPKDTRQEEWTAGDLENRV